MQIETNWKQAIKFLGGDEENEQQLIANLGRQVHQEVADIASQNHAAPQRPQHAKMIAGITNAIFKIEEQLSTDFTYGFLKPAASYPAVVRFSNAAAYVTSDDSNDLRGAAIEITPGEGLLHDFLMTNAEEHHAKDALEAMATSLAFYRPGTENKINGMAALTAQLGQEAANRIVTTISRQSKIPVESIATETFWSRAPIRIGQIAVKYRLYPVLTKVVPEKTNSDLVEDFKLRVSKGDVRYLFQVQRYFNEELTPLEDARFAWQTPFETIAELIIPKQVLIHDDNIFEKLHFNPWKVNTKDFEPIGNMNRARKSSICCKR